MNCYLVTYNQDTVTEAVSVYIPGYDGDPYGDTVPFTVGSNQSIIPVDSSTREMRNLCDEMKCLDPRLDDSKATTAAMAALDAATEVLGKVPFTGGCKAFYTAREFDRLKWRGSVGCDVACVIMCDGGEFSDMLNVNKARYEQLKKFHQAMENRGYVLRHLTHFAYGVVRRTT